MAVATPSNQRIWQEKLARQARLRFVGGVCTGLPELATHIQLSLQQAPAKPGSAFVQPKVTVGNSALDFDRHHRAWVNAATKLLREGLVDSAAGVVPVSTGTFELVTDEAMEGKIFASRLAAQIVELVAAVFDGVRRVSQFLEDKELHPMDVLRPETVCLKLIEAWEIAGLPKSTLELIRPALVELLGKLLCDIYTSVQQFYTDQNAASDEDLRAHRIRRTESDASRLAAGGTGAAANAGGGFTGGTATAMPIPPTRVQAQATGYPAAVSQLVQAQKESRSVLTQLRGFLGAASGAASQPLAQAPAGTVESGAYGVVDGAVHSGRAIVVSQALQQALVGSPAALQSSWFKTIPGDPSYDAAQAITPVSVAIRQQSSSLKQVATSDEEKAIIEIIALMFQSIVNEDRIPAGIRIWFARLQVPVLRVALSEPAFFNDTEHPARQLIDRMGACVLGFDTSANSGSVLEAEVKRIVQVIEQYPDTGSRVFQLVLKEFQKFLEKNLTEQTPRAHDLVSLAQQVEQKETLAIQYTIQLRDMLLSIPVGAEIRGFLFKQWADVLAMSAIKFGAEHENTKKFKQVALDLVWCASAKPNKEDRAKVIRQLPVLQTVLRQGLTLVNMVDERQDEAVKSLMDIVAGAFLAKTNEIPREQIEALAKRLAHLENALDDVVTQEYPLSAESIELLLGIDASSIHVVADNDTAVQPEVLEWAKTLTLGNWFMLDHNGSQQQVQYVWHSQQKQLQLFVALNGFCFLFQLRRLGNYLQAGLLVPRDIEGITARAARDALKKIQANPERLLQ